MNEVYWCPTKSISDVFIKRMKAEGFVCGEDAWYSYGKETCYRQSFPILCYASRDFYKTEGYDIVPAFNNMSIYGLLKEKGKL